MRGQNKKKRNFANCFVTTNNTCIGNFLKKQGPNSNNLYKRECPVKTALSILFIIHKK